MASGLPIPTVVLGEGDDRVSGGECSSSSSSLFYSDSPPETPVPEFPFDPVCGEYVRIDAFYSDSSEPTGTLVKFPLETHSGKVGGVASVLKMAKIQELANQFHIPSTVHLIEPRPSDRACSPPIGYCTVYEDCLKCGLRLPLFHTFSTFLRKFGIPLAQIMPNSFKQLSGLTILIGRYNTRPSVKFILRFFQLKRSEDWFYLSPRLGFKLKTKNKITNWQKKFFFCQADEVNVPEFEWRTGKIADVTVGRDYGFLEKALIELGEVDEDFTEDEMVSTGLSPYDPTKAVKGEAPFCLT